MPPKKRTHSEEGQHNEFQRVKQLVVDMRQARGACIACDKDLTANASQAIYLNPNDLTLRICTGIYNLCFLNCDDSRFV